MREFEIPQADDVRRVGRAAEQHENHSREQRSLHGRSK